MKPSQSVAIYNYQRDEKLEKPWPQENNLNKSTPSFAFQNEKRNNPLYRSEEITTTSFDATVHLPPKNYIPKNSTKNAYFYLDTPSKKKEQQEPYTFQSKQNQNEICHITSSQ